MQPRYQIFVSSTFRDLREERQAVLEAILELNHFPSGMETFPAADATPWELITSIISESDYYVLIIGGKYGSTGPEGISYTEMEFNLAVELKKPIIAFVHADPDQIPAGKSELTEAAREALQKFRAVVSDRLCKSWTTKDNLKAAVISSLLYAIRTKPALGWIKNEGITNQELLQRLANLQERFDIQSNELDILRKQTQINSDTTRFSGLDSYFSIKVNSRQYEDVTDITKKLSEIFYYLASEMLVPCSEDSLRRHLGKLIEESLKDTPLKIKKTRSEFSGAFIAIPKFSADIKSVERILYQLMAIKLIEPQLIQKQAGSDGKIDTHSERWWILTDLGKNKFLEKAALSSIDDRAA